MVFIEARLPQFWNAFLPIELIEDGRSSEVKPRQPVNEAFPMVLTDVGIVIVVNPLQSQNADSIIADTDDGIV